MFNKKSKQIKNLKSQILEDKKNNNSVQVSQIEDFELILNQIKDLTNSKGQWKHNQSAINNAINLALENYKNKKVDLIIDSEI